MKTHLTYIALGMTLLLGAMACRGSTGSCLINTPNGYNACEDFLGTMYDPTAAQSNCDGAGGRWSPNACDDAAALGICDVVIGNGATQNVRYTYYANGDATTRTVETVCGLAGGAFTAP